MKKQNKNFCIYQAEKEEFRLRLKEKLKEELAEFSESEELEELADILEVFKALAEEYGYSLEEIEQCRLKKKEQRGAFLKRYILEY